MNNLVLVLKLYSILVITNLIYMFIIYNRVNRDDHILSNNVDDNQLYHPQYFKFSGNWEVDTVLHGINMLILQILIQVPFVWVMWPNQNTIKLYLSDRRNTKLLKRQAQFNNHKVQMNSNYEGEIDDRSKSHLTDISG